MRSHSYLRAGFMAMVTGIILLTATSAFGAATIIIQNGDGPNVGFNDPSPRAPVGGNPGTTLGQQRLNAFQAAANIWGATLNSSPTITVLATWEALPCTSNSAVLGSAGAVSIAADFPNAVFPGTWYSISLANKLAVTDLNGGSAEIRARFNVNLGNAGCFEGFPFYLGLDNNHGASDDLVTVVLHEFSHGLGFQTFTSSSSGVQTSGIPTIYDRFLMDDSSGKTWVQMTDAERQASAINTGNLVWNGLQVTGTVPLVLGGSPRLKVNSPAGIAGDYLVGTAAFGAPLSSPGVTANVVQATDPSDGNGASTTDGCSALTNPGAVSGNIALIDRGTCTFVTKVKNAQNAGAVGVIIVDNVAGSPPPPLGGTDPTITIPSVRVTLADGTTIRNQLGSGVNATLDLDLSKRAGADAANRPLMYAPNPVVGGSSVSHFDTSEFPNQLMEPNSSSDLTHNVTQPSDLTYALLRDIGWVAPSETTIQFSASNYNANEGDGSSVVTLNRTGDVAGVSSVLISSSNGTANQLRDYEAANGVVVFSPTQTSRTFRVLIVDDAFPESSETINLGLSNNQGAVAPTPTATVTIIDNDSAGSTSPVARQFVSNLVGAEEVPPTGNTVKGNGGIFQLASDDLSAKVSLVFSGLTGSETGAHVHAGAPGVNGPIIFPLPLGNPINNEVFNPTAQQVIDLRAGQQYMNVHSTSFMNGEIRGQLLWNPAEEADFFVRQAYFDFLGRIPDAGGFAFWQAEITQCQSNVQCLRNKRVDVSNAFFYELEFQQTAAYVLRLYRAAYGNNQPFPNPNPNPGFPNEEKKIPSYAAFVSDRTRVIGGSNLAQRQFDLAGDFVNRPEFLVKYPLSLATAGDFVDAVLATLQTDMGVNLSGQRANLINVYNTQGGRGGVMYRLADDNTSNPVSNQPFIDAEYNRTFVLGQYFGYLRRNPDIPGFIFWLGQVNGAPLRDVPRQHAMVCSFITATEYQLRFGPVASRNNNECPQ
jgi:CHRD domain/PA domain/Calx-beta domain